jgi:hypothetical protein
MLAYVHFITIKKMAETELIAPDIGVKNAANRLSPPFFMYICCVFASVLVSRGFDFSIMCLFTFAFPFVMTFMTSLSVDNNIAEDHLRALRMELYHLRQELRESQRRCVHHHHQ